MPKPSEYLFIVHGPLISQNQKIQWPFEFYFFIIKIKNFISLLSLLVYSNINPTSRPMNLILRHWLKYLMISNISISLDMQICLRTYDKGWFGRPPRSRKQNYDYEKSIGNSIYTPFHGAQFTSIKGSWCPVSNCTAASPRHCLGQGCAAAGELWVLYLSSSKKDHFSFVFRTKVDKSFDRAETWLLIHKMATIILTVITDFAAVT